MKVTLRQLKQIINETLLISETVDSAPDADSELDLYAIQQDLKSTLESIGYSVKIPSILNAVTLVSLDAAPSEAVARGLQAALNQVAHRHGLPSGAFDHEPEAMGAQRAIQRMHYGPRALPMVVGLTQGYADDPFAKKYKVLDADMNPDTPEEN
tara:strand:- start:1206 stop:1667 length:462 start_codon:yes stop_codon:yes gene_type:complete